MAPGGPCFYGPFNERLEAAGIPTCRRPRKPGKGVTCGKASCVQRLRAFRAQHAERSAQGQPGDWTDEEVSAKALLKLLRISAQRNAAARNCPFSDNTLECSCLVAPAAGSPCPFFVTSGGKVCAVPW